MEDRSGAVIGVERDAPGIVGGVLVRMGMGFPIIVRVVGRCGRAMGVVVPMIDVVKERKEIEAGEPAESGSTRGEGRTRPASPVPAFVRHDSTEELIHRAFPRIIHGVESESSRQCRSEVGRHGEIHH